MGAVGFHAPRCCRALFPWKVLMAASKDASATWEIMASASRCARQQLFFFGGIKVFNRVKQLQQWKAMWGGPGDLLETSSPVLTGGRCVGTRRQRTTRKPEKQM